MRNKHLFLATREEWKETSHGKEVAPANATKKLKSAHHFLLLSTIC